MPLPVLGIGAVVGGAVSAWFSRKLLSIVSKVGLSTFQTGLAWTVIAFQVTIALAVVSLIALIYNMVNDLLAYAFGLQNSANETIQTSVNVVKAVGAWDGTIDGLTLVMPLFSAFLIIKLSMLGIRVARTVSEQADKVIKTALSHGF